MFRLFKAFFLKARGYLLQDPDRLNGVRVSSVVALVLVPFIFLGKPFIGVSLALGVLAGALSETDDHPQGRVEALMIKTFAFFIASAGVELVQNSALLTAFGLGGSTIVCILIGGISDRYRGIMFGTLLVALYTMIGLTNNPPHFVQPFLLPLGAAIYGMVSLWQLRRNQWRLLDEQLARGFSSLATYFTTKAGLFPANAEEQRKIRNTLAVINQQIVTQLDGCRGLINNYRDYDGESHDLRFYLHCFMLLQSLHERAASSHQRYDSLSDEETYCELIEGIGAATGQLGIALGQLAESLLSERGFKYPIVLDWLIAGLKTELKEQHIPADHPFHFMITNLSASAASLYNMEDDRLRQIAPQLAKDNRSYGKRFIDQLSWENGRLRYALRLAICFVAGIAVAEVFNIAKGEWIVLTSLFVCQPTYGETRRRILQRILGTVSGVIAGSVLLQLVPTEAGKTILFLLSNYAFFYWLKRDYHIAVIFVTIIVLCAFDLMTGSGAAIMMPRLLDTVLGSMLALISVRLLWPEWQYKRLPQLLKDAIKTNSEYLRMIIEEYKHSPAPVTDDLDYRVARRKAHRADAALVTAWRDMQLEPKQYRRFCDDAYRFTHLNHALLSFISAFGAHKSKHGEFDHKVGAIAQDVLHFLEETAGERTLREEEKGKKGVETEQLLAQINETMKKDLQNEARQQLLLLRNICELTTALKDKAVAQPI